MGTFGSICTQVYSKINDLLIFQIGSILLFVKYLLLWLLRIKRKMIG